MFRLGSKDTRTQSRKRLGELLLNDGIVSEDQLQKALTAQRKDGGFVGQILIEQNALTLNTLINYLVKQCKIPHLSLLDYEIGEDALNQVPRELCLKYYLLPIDKLGRILTLAMVDPLDTDALEEVQKQCPELRIKPMLCTWDHFQAVVKRLYSVEPKQPQNLVEKYAQFGLTPPEEIPEKKEPAISLSEDVVEPEFHEDLSSPAANATPHKPQSEAESVDRNKTGDSLTADRRPVSASKGTGVSWGDMRAEMQVLAAALSESIRDSITEVIETLNKEKAPPMDLKDLASSFGHTFEETLQVLTEELRQEREILREELKAHRIQENADAGAQDSRQVQNAQMAVLTEAFLAATQNKEGASPELARIAESILKSFEDDQALQTGRQEQLAQIAQAALESVRQTTQLLEAHGVSENNRSDLMRRRQTQHASVAPFFSVDAIAADDVAYSEEDKRVRDALDSECPPERLTFANFFPGEANAFTFKLGKAIAEAPGADYNPLFLYGKVGLGKTHLISAIGNAILSLSLENSKVPPARVGYVSASHFARRMAAAAADNAIEIFRDSYCHWDVLILDDIQFLGGRIEAQEEFFHIFNVLLQQKRQIIIAGDKAPDRLGLLEQRLVSRFASGIVAELKAPEWETRMRILRHHVEETKIKVPEEVLSLIAMQVPDDIRKMTGALRKIIAFAHLEDSKISVEDAQKILSHLNANEAA